VTAVVTLGLRISVTTDIFFAVYSLLLRSLPYYDASRLVSLSDAHSRSVAPYSAIVSRHFSPSGRQTFDLQLLHHPDRPNFDTVPDSRRILATCLPVVDCFALSFQLRS
jgi:hypothetical protein